MGAAGYGGYDGYNSDQPTTALRPADPNNAQTSMLPPINPDDGGYDDRAGRAPAEEEQHLDDPPDRRGRPGAHRRDPDRPGGPRGQFERQPDQGPEPGGLHDRGGGDARFEKRVTVKKGAEEPCEQQEKGQICTQDPAADATMDKDGTVTVVVSSGAPTVEVPNVMEKSEDGAREELEKKGFTVNVTTKESDKPEGTVIKQDPKGGEQADEESEVTITLAVQATLDLPDMRTRTFEAAQQQLNGIGFTNVSRTDVESDRLGEVIEQTPTGPSKQGKDVQIVLKVSKGPAGEGPDPRRPRRHVVPGREGLEGLGFVVQLAPGSVDRPDARVVTSSPPPSTEADKGSTVMLVTVDGGGGDGGRGPGRRRHPRKLGPLNHRPARSVRRRAPVTAMVTGALPVEQALTVPVVCGTRGGDVRRPWRGRSAPVARVFGARGAGARRLLRGGSAAPRRSAQFG